MIFSSDKLCGNYLVDLAVSDNKDSLQQERCICNELENEPTKKCSMVSLNILTIIREVLEQRIDTILRNNQKCNKC